MKGYSRTDVFSDEEVRMLVMATKLVDAIDETRVQGILRCHELARAIGMTMLLHVQDGSYGNADHSWLWTNGKGSTILDVYVIGSLPQVQLRDHFICPYQWQSNMVRNDIREDVVKELLEQLKRAY